MTRILY